MHTFTSYSYIRTHHVIISATFRYMKINFNMVINFDQLAIAMF